MIKRTEDKLEAHFKHPSQEHLSSLETELMLWYPKHHATFELTLDTLNVQNAFHLRDILTGPALVHLLSQSVTYVIEFKQLLPDALRAFFQKDTESLDLAFLPETDREKFLPDNMHFKCTEAAQCDIWLQALSHAHQADRLSNNMRLYLDIGAIDAPQENTIYQLLEKTAGKLQVYHADPEENWHRMTRPTSTPKPQGTLRVRRMDRELQIDTRQAASVNPYNFRYNSLFSRLRTTRARLGSITEVPEGLEADGSPSPRGAAHN